MMWLHFSFLIRNSIILLSLPHNGNAECSSTYSYSCIKYSQKSNNEYGGCGFMGWGRCFRHHSYFQSSYYTTCSSQCPSTFGWSSWETWSSWGACPYPSNDPYRARLRYRTCHNSNGNCCYCGSLGSRSSGSEHQKCVHGEWNRWSEWLAIGSCPASCTTCGSSSFPQQKYYRTRTCDNPLPSNGGHFCGGSSTEYRYENCNINYCQVDGAWGSWNGWSNWDTCSATCHHEGNSQPTQTSYRNRLCNSPSPGCQGKACSGTDKEYTRKSCDTNFCPVDCVCTWGSWEEWTSCSKTCETGAKLRVRLNKCTHPKHGGKPCTKAPLEDKEPRSCNAGIKCPVHGDWTPYEDWSDWSPCSHSCGGGLRKRTRLRSCTNPSPLNGGRECDGSKEHETAENCNTLPCPNYCVCSGSGDPHYYTPDGATIHFYGTCKYTLWESTADEKCAFKVETKNERRDGNNFVAWTRMIDYIAATRTNIRILQDGLTLINGTSVSLPATIANDTIEVTRSGDFVTINHPECNVHVQFDGKHQVVVKVSKDRFSGNLTGLCGNCNGKVDDDYRTKYGQNGGFADIGNSYKVFDDSDQPDFNCANATNPPPPSKDCKDKAKSDFICGYLRSDSSPFKVCKDSANVDFAQLYFSCEYDVCSSGQDNAHCQTLESAALACSSKGIQVKWRRPDFCPKTCTGDFVYKPSVSCTNTCDNPNVSMNCQNPPVDGCTCPDKKFLHGGKCVTFDNCGSCILAIDDTTTKLAVGDVFPKGDCIKSHKCVLKDGLPTLVSSKPTAICLIDEPCAINSFGEYACRKKIDGFWTWGEWGTWGECSTTCESGLRQRIRLNVCTEPRNGGKPCGPAKTRRREFLRCDTYIKCPYEDDK